MVDLESGVKTLGFRGEALSSLSDMGILEIVTRVRGSPNTYKKVLKVRAGSVCLQGFRR